MPARRTLTHRPPRQRHPELERDISRSPELGYEAPEDAGCVRYLEHGFPTRLARWHCHDEYELHMIVATSGKAFVGDWIGQFQPGHLVLTGPRLPHNWISLDVPQEGIALRDLVIQFLHAPIARASEQIPELSEVLPLLQRARHGVEFFELGERAAEHFQRIKLSRGLERFAYFCSFLTDLARCSNFRLLSNVQMQASEDDDALDRINAIVNRITQNVALAPSLSEVARELGISESRLSRFFRRATGNTFTDFVNRVRVHRACQLLMESDRYVANICYDVGFNNVANFNRRFLEIKGMTPSEFRRESHHRFGAL